MSPIKNITVVGAGLMGVGIAQVFACHGHRAALVDVSEEQLEKALGLVAENLDSMKEYGLFFPDSDEAILNRISLTTDMETACENCDFAFEAVYENMELKQKIMAEMDSFAPENAILCSNTSVMSIQKIASKSKKRNRIVGTHWWNPPHLIPLVEVVRTDDSDVENAEKTFELLESVGKKPIHVYKDVPGFVANRLQHALWREAFHLIDEEICDPETVDIAIKNGFGMRLPALGPVENADMIGLDLTLAIHDYILEYLYDSPIPSKTLRKAVAAKNLGFKSGKGFQEWTEADCEKSRKALSDYLLKTISQNQK